MHIASWYRTGNDQRCSRIINQHGVDFIDHCEVMLSLHQVSTIPSHVVSEVVKTKFVVGTVDNITGVRLFSSCGIWRIFVNTIHAQSVEFKNWGIPFGVTLCQIIVDRHDMNATTSQCIQVGRQSRNQRFSFPSRHFGDFSFVENHTTDQLDIVMNHIPNNFRAGCQPAIMPNGNFSLDFNILFGYRQFPISHRSGNFQFSVFLKSAGSFFNYCKSLRHDLVQDFFQRLIALLLKLVYLIEELIFFLNRLNRKRLNLSFYFSNFLINCCQLTVYNSFDFLSFCSQLIIAKIFQTGEDLICLFYSRK